MATYNRAHLIEESLISIQNQSFQEWECLIIDDGSTDNTQEKVSDLVTADNRIKYLKRPKNYKKGLPGCRNYGLDLAKGEFVIFYDDDDLVHPENLTYCVNLIKRSKYYFIRYNKQPFFGSSGPISMEPIKNSQIASFSISEIEKMIIGDIPFASCCVLWNKKCFEGEKFNENLMYAEEWECFTRVLTHGYNGLNTDAVLYYNRKHSDSNTGEFYRKDEIRLTSKITATELIIQNLGEKNMFSPSLKDYFIQLGFQLNSKRIIELSLQYSENGLLERMKYKIGYLAYPILRPLFILKGKLLSR